ncbi:hypothetical protein LX64_02716 [Chitinophaga skermanii]|uniref:Uncharacterized protein n=1 Tax=Chitinophaga skermanii TaxID=331697 RepID=A0A327QH16_9BACT|nr:hypothetical protein [Chitinophaga skermanii]RAJ03839.1 hypothetical protein LX64_02716 [Chitinophaga skermanii]
MSVDINISNYEQYLLCYIDGELNPEEIAALELFLEKYPDLRQELAQLEAVKLLPEEEIVFDNKAMLYRGAQGVHQHNYQSYMLSKVDGELSKAGEAELAAFLQNNPAYQGEMAAFMATKLQPDTSIGFGDKSVLYKHRQKVQPIWLRRTAWYAAAAVIAGIMVWQLPGMMEDRSVTPAQTTTTTATNEQNTTNAETVEPSNTPAVSPQSNDIAIASNDAMNTTTQQASMANHAAHVQVDNTTSAASEQTVAAKAAFIEPVNVSTSSAPTTVNSNIAAVNNTIALHKEETATSTAKIDPEIAIASSQTGQENEASRFGATTATMATPPPPPPGELIMSISSSGEGKLLDKVTNVARFFGKKKRN